jgi:chromosome segregation ATPase
MSTKWEKFDQIERDQKRVKEKLAELRESKAIYGDTDDQLELWDRLRDDAEDGKSVFTPSERPKKRQRSNNFQKQRKKRTSGKASDDDDNYTESASDEEESVEARNTSQGNPLTLEMIEGKISELKSTKKEARLQRRELDSKMLTLKEELKDLDAAHDDIEAEMSTICISGRNQYSKGAIQQDVSLSCCLRP